MRDLKNLYLRANACVACHQNIDNGLLKAGHPSLVFELDSQSINEPKHWRDDHPWSGARAWLIGQAVALREAAWRSRTDPDPAPDMQETAMALAWLLEKVTSAEPLLPKILEPDSSDLEALQRQSDELARAAANWNPNATSALSLLRVLAGTESHFVQVKGSSPTSLSYRAKRLVLALDRLAGALSQNQAALMIANELKVLQEDVRGPGSLDSARFAEHLGAFRKKL